MFKIFRELYLLNKYIKCNSGGYRCGTSTVVDVRRLKAKNRHYPACNDGAVLWLPGKDIRSVTILARRNNLSRLPCLPLTPHFTPTSLYI